MAETTRIRWTDATFNPWRGCTKFSRGCDICYAMFMSRKGAEVFGTWGPHGVRAIAAEAYWRKPLKWDRDAARAGVRRRVFCASLADVFEDRPDLVAPRERLWRLIEQTPNLDWLLLTKRPENIASMLPPAWLKKPQPNVWLGATVEAAEYAEARVAALVAVPAVVHFLSLEPLLGPIPGLPLDGIDWVIVGGESGPRKVAPRQMLIEWVREIRDLCVRRGVAFFFKQWGGSGRDKGGHALDGRAYEAWPEPRFVAEASTAVPRTSAPDRARSGRSST